MTKNAVVENYTPHALTICAADGTPIREIPSSGVARVASQAVQKDPVDGIPVVETVFGEVSGLPAPVPGVYYVVSVLVIQALPERTDLLRPDTGPQNVVRDGDGKIVGVKALTR